MAETPTAARPYAKAAFEFARDQKALDDWAKMLEILSSVVDNDDMRTRVLSNPRLSSDEKVDLISDICGDSLTVEGRNFLSVIGRKGRLAVLPAIAEQFVLLKSQQEKRVDVDIVSAFPLDKAQEDKLASALAKRLDREISITTQVDKSLLGGVILRTGDTVIDGSVRGRLDRLHEILSV